MEKGTKVRIRSLYGFYNVLGKALIEFPFKGPLRFLEGVGKFTFCLSAL